MSLSSEAKIPDELFREMDIALLVHELKDPLSLVETGIRTVLERTGSDPLSPRQEKTLKRALRGALRARSLVNHLLEIGRSEAGRFAAAPFRPFEAVYATLLECIETMEGELSDRVKEEKTQTGGLALLGQAGISLRGAPELENAEMVQDPIKFNLVTSNLIKNALRFRKNVLEISLYRENDLLAVDVRDDGPGIRPEDHALIFERYAQVDAGAALERKGHGLGLAGALILARRLGGDISVASEPGRGATFHLTVPFTLKEDHVI
jgi:signal transduction histidine kinase